MQEKSYMCILHWKSDKIRFNRTTWQVCYVQSSLVLNAWANQMSIKIASFVTARWACSLISSFYDVAATLLMVSQCRYLWLWYVQFILQLLLFAALVMRQFTLYLLCKYFFQSQLHDSSTEIHLSDIMKQLTNKFTLLFLYFFMNYVQSHKYWLKKVQSLKP